MASRVFKKEYIFLLLFVIVIAITGFVLIRYIALIGVRSSTASPMIKPAYLLQPIPKIDKLKTILDNPKFKEMIYAEEFFAPIEVGEIGRPNPFMPFRKEGEELKGVTQEREPGDQEIEKKRIR